MKSFDASSPCKLIAVTVVSIFAAISPASFAASDGFEAYRLQQQQEAQKTKAEFQEYKENQDREFSNFLKSQWREFETFQGKVRIKEPEPKVAPVAPPSARPAEKPFPVVKPVIPPPAPPMAQEPKPRPVAANELEITFYGNTVKFGFDPKWKSYRFTGGAKPEAFSEFWTMMSGSTYEPAIQAINSARRELKLDDWGYVSLWRSVVQALQPGKSEQNMLLWFFLVKSGYDVRLGYYQSDVYLFVAIKQQVYSTKYTRVSNQNYYAALEADHGNGIGSFYTYDANYPARLNPLDIQSAATAFTKSVPAQRALAFDYKGKTIKLAPTYDRRLVEYMGTFPQSEFELYFDTDGSSLLHDTLLSDLRKYTATMGQEEAVDFLLTFVQKAFAYKRDDEQFGYERYFFVEEDLHYPYIDCKKRSVLFAWLVHELVGIKVIGLIYPGHMTTAVALGDVKPGFSVVDHQGTRFVIADPTYIGAPIGMAMPSYAKLKPNRVVDIQLPSTKLASF